MHRIIGGGAGIVVGHPFDTIKVRLQADRCGHFVSPLQSLKKTVRNEGVRGLFKGLSSPLVGNVPIQAMLFGGFGFFMKLLNFNQYHSSTAAQPLWHHFVAGSAIGVLQVPLTCSIELVKIRMQNQQFTMRRDNTNTSNGRRGFSGSWDCARQLYARHGTAGLMQGFRCSLYRDVWYGVYFWLYEATRRLLIGGNGEQLDRSLSALETMAAGAISGAVSWFIIYPIDVVKTRIQLQQFTSPAGVWDITRQIWANEGAHVFFKGVGTTVVRAIPVNMITFLGFEIVLKVGSI